MAAPLNDDVGLPVLLGQPCEEAGSVRPAPTPLGAQERAEDGMLRVCCGNFILPHLAEIREHLGQTLFVTVWHCPRCDRITR